MPSQSSCGMRLSDSSDNIPAIGGDIPLPLLPHQAPPAISRTQSSVARPNRWCSCCDGILHSVRNIVCEPKKDGVRSFEPSATQHLADHLNKIGMDVKDYHVIKELFNFLDKNGDGYIHKEAFLQMVQDLGMTIKEPEEEFAAIDADCNGLITLPDFVEWSRLHKCGNSLSNIKRAFDVIDATGRGHISVLDFCKLASSLDHNYASLNEMIEAYQEIDRDRDGFISWEQFARVWNELTITQKRMSTAPKRTLSEVNWNAS